MSGPADPSVAVVGDPSLVEPIGAAGAEPATGTAASVLDGDPDWVVAAGDAALAALAEAGVDVPVLAVDCDPGIPSTPRSALGDAVAAVGSGAAPTVTRRTFAASVDGDPVGTLLRDAALVTAEPARISEYGVHAGGREVARFRADGVVVATPAGSRGYLGDAGGPTLALGTGVLAALPVAPFQIDSDHWVLDDGGVALSVHRDEHVVLVLDGERRRRVPRDARVELTPAGELALLAPRGDWKNSNGRRTE